MVVDIMSQLSDPLKMQEEGSVSISSTSLKCLIVVYSYHLNNTAKIAQVMSEVLSAKIKTPDQITQYDLIGFGAGIAAGRHYKPMLDFVDRLDETLESSHASSKKCFIFSTSAIVNAKKIYKDHAALRDKLIVKHFDVLDEFGCRGFNTNKFLKYFGGMGKGCPNLEDLNNAREFARKVLEKMREGECGNIEVSQKKMLKGSLA